MVASKLILDWSPERISGWLKLQYPDDQSLRVSHKTIYRSLFIQARGVLKKELLDQLRARTKTRICCCGNTSREAPTCLSIRKCSSTRSRCA